MQRKYKAIGHYPVLPSLMEAMLPFDTLSNIDFEDLGVEVQPKFGYRAVFQSHSRFRTFRLHLNT